MIIIDRTAVESTSNLSFNIRKHTAAIFRFCEFDTNRSCSVGTTVCHNEQKTNKRDTQTNDKPTTN
jgi:hypothetical protein